MNVSGMNPPGPRLMASALSRAWCPASLRPAIAPDGAARGDCPRCRRGCMCASRTACPAPGRCDAGHVLYIPANLLPILESRALLHVRKQHHHERHRAVWETGSW